MTAVVILAEFNIDFNKRTLNLKP